MRKNRFYKIFGLGLAICMALGMPTTSVLEAATKPATKPAEKVLSSLKISANTLALEAGNTKSLTLNAQYTVGRPVSITSKAAWSTSNSSVATVTNGRVKAVGAGTAVITASYMGKSVTTSVTVSKKLKILEVSSKKVDLLRNDSKKVSVTAVYTDSSKENVTDKVTWQVKGNAVTVDKGLIKPKEAGSATVTASFGNKKATVSVQVDQMNKLLVTTQQLHLFKDDDDFEIKATAIYKAGSNEDVTSKATWTSTNTDIVTVKNGKIIPRKAGKAIVKVKFGNKNVNITVNVY
ncbi:Ig-like domain-containing protein [Brevibacillus laterosporus]|uniref:Ig-like domain-containing protein n=1 Tax=Brevibacillus laterosporus TaxID=1465 RepID=UPI003D1F67EA